MSKAYIWRETMQDIVSKALKEGESAFLLAIGHKDSGKSFSVMGENNFSLMKNCSTHINDYDDSRGLFIRSLYDISVKDPEAKVEVQIFDISLDNVRDLLKYAKKEQRKT
jgi:hypothetical protein